MPPAARSVPSWPAFLARFVRRTLRGAPLAFTLGFWLFILNWPIGLGGAALCGLLALHFSPRACGIAAAAVYGLSWAMLGLGTLLLGATAKTRIVNRFRRSLAAYRRLRTAQNPKPQTTP